MPEIRVGPKPSILTPSKRRSDAPAEPDPADIPAADPLAARIAQLQAERSAASQAAIEAEATAQLDQELAEQNARTQREAASKAATESLDTYRCFIESDLRAAWLDALEQQRAAEHARSYAYALLDKADVLGAEAERTELACEDVGGTLPNLTVVGPDVLRSRMIDRDIETAAQRVLSAFQAIAGSDVRPECTERLRRFCHVVHSDHAVSVELVGVIVGVGGLGSTPLGQGDPFV